MPQDTQYGTSKVLTRRDIIKAGVLGGLLLPAMAAVPVQAARLAIPSSAGAMKIAFRNQHTGESFNGVYRVGDRYMPEAFEQINHVLRDFRTGEVFPFDPRVIDILYSVHEKSGSNEPYEVLSGYRSPKTNALLARNGDGVAQNSLHMTGQAIDIRLPGFSTKKLSDLGAGLRAGGVGYYRKSNFVHMDTGQVRRWS
ncbi:MAG: DUF882 domain-containing protein [Rhodospirillales bacterium]|nr:DUF882 domain-containing protein [Rhodospirillales bacterium]MCB9995485.1 DUF882 domain-containing protein [Rhodospirillales bacterium]